MERIEFSGWPNCVRLANSAIELIITADVGPRIIRCGIPGGPNVFNVLADQAGLTGGDQWRSYGGHRLWHAPESQPRTYAPDNRPVRVEEGSGSLRFIQAVEESTGIQKEMEISLHPSEATVSVVHRLRNTSLWDIRLSVWALSVMADSGVAVLPLPPRGQHSEQLTASSRLVLWAYTDLADPRLAFGSRAILVRQDPTSSTPNKIGASVPDGWVAYVLGSQMFVKQFEFDPHAEYPDMGSSAEIFTNPEILEVETLSPMQVLSPGHTAEHRETWSLVQGVAQPANPAEVETHILPALQNAGLIG